MSFIVIISNLDEEDDESEDDDDDLEVEDEDLEVDDESVNQDYIQKNWHHDVCINMNKLYTEITRLLTKVVLIMQTMMPVLLNVILIDGFVINF